jgi:hypothetical protein
MLPIMYMPSADITHFSQSSSQLLHRVNVNLEIFSYLGRIYVIENGQNCEPRVSHTFDDLSKFNEAPSRGSIVCRDNGNCLHGFLYCF